MSFFLDIVSYVFVFPALGFLVFLIIRAIVSWRRNPVSFVEMHKKRLQRMK